MTVSRTLVLIALAGVAAAAEDLAEHRAVNDLRAFGQTTAEYTGGDGSDLKTKRGVRAGAGFFHSFVDEFEGDVTGILLGVELSQEHASGDNGVKVEDVAATIHGGFAYQTEFHPIHVEIDPYLGIGRARVESDALGTDHSVFWSVGLRFGAFWTFDMGLQLGLDVRWESENCRVHAPEHEERVATHGITGGGSVGWRF